MLCIAESISALWFKSVITANITSGFDIANISWKIKCVSRSYDILFFHKLVIFFKQNKCILVAMRIYLLRNILGVLFF